MSNADLGRPVVAVLIGAQWRDSVLDRRARARLGAHAEVVELDPATLRPLAPTTVDASAARVLLTSWEAPRLDADVLARFPQLGLVAHAAGSIRGVVTDDVWTRGIRVCNAVAANAVSVADFTVAQLHLALKNTWRLALASRDTGRVPERAGVHGLDGATIALVGLGAIGRLVAERFRDRDVRLLAHDPYLPPDVAAELGIESVTLAGAFRRADVLSLHAPLTDATRHLIDGELLRSLPVGATLINTARGGLIDHDVLAAVLGERPDLLALLDVTEPEPLPAGHPLLRLQNVVVTPHIAGSLGTEEARLGALATDEILRFLRGRALAHEVVEARAAISA